MRTTHVSRHVARYSSYFGTGNTARWKRSQVWSQTLKAKYTYIHANVLHLKHGHLRLLLGPTSCANTMLLLSRRCYMHDQIMYTRGSACNRLEIWNFVTLPKKYKTHMTMPNLKAVYFKPDMSKPSQSATGYLITKPQILRQPKTHSCNNLNNYT